MKWRLLDPFKWLLALTHRFLNNATVISDIPTPHGESVAAPVTLVLIILSLISGSDIKDVKNKLSNPFSETNVHGEKHLREVDKCRNSVPNINNFILNDIYCQYTVQDSQCPEWAGHHRPPLPPNIHWRRTLVILNTSVNVSTRYITTTHVQLIDFQKMGKTSFTNLTELRSCLL